MTDPDTANFYGRIKGAKTLQNPPPLLIKSRGNLEQDLPALGELRGVSREVRNPSRDQIAPANDFWSDARPLWLEVGAYKAVASSLGEWHQPRRNPEVGAYWLRGQYLNGACAHGRLGKIRAAGVSNLRVYPWDVRRPVRCAALTPAWTVSFLFNNSRPVAQKVRHHRRRVRDRQSTCGHFARAMRPRRGVFAWPPNISLIMCARPWTKCRKRVRNCLTARPRRGNRHIPWKDWVSTRYEQKGFARGAQAAFTFIS